MSDEDRLKTTTIPTFDGKDSKYQQWWDRFESYAMLNGFHQALIGEANLPKDSMREK